MKNIAFGITFFPFSWQVGYWDRGVGKKKLLSIGPIRFVFYPDVKGTWGVNSHA